MNLIAGCDRESRLRQIIVRHTDFVEATDRIAECHELTSGARLSSYLLILGEAGVGKTTLLKSYAERHPRRRIGKTEIVPVLYVEIPPSPSLISVLNTFLAAYGTGYALGARKNIGDLTRQLIKLIEMAQTSVILVDELQNFMTQASHTQTKALAALLKTLMNQARVSLVAAGVPESLRLVDADDQLRSRMSSEIWLTPFNIETKEAYEVFRKTLLAIETSLEFTEPSFLYRSPFAERIYYACDGRFRHLTSLLSNAIRIVEKGGMTHITQQVLKEAFLRSFRAGISDRDNPFSEDFMPRRLTGRGEVHGARAKV